MLRQLQAKARDEAEANETVQYSEFKRTYQDDPAAFVVDCINWDEVPNTGGPAPYQLEILSELTTKHRVSARGPHGLGKTALEAWVLLWFSLVYDGRDWKALTTASAWRQLTVYLWPEIHKWTRYLRWDKIGRMPFGQHTTSKELLERQLKLTTGQATAVASNDHAKIEGAHADYLLFAFDESKAVPDSTFDAVEGAFSTGVVGYALAVSTPGAPLGRFYDIHSRKPGYEDWWVRHVTRDEAIAAGRMSLGWAEQRRKQWGENSALYKNRVLGEFAESSSDAIIPLAWVEAANERWHEWQASSRRDDYCVVIGVDVGEQNDSTVLAPRYGDNIGTLEVHQGLDTMKVVAKVVAMQQRKEVAERVPTAVVDAIGIGSGVVSRLRELDMPVVPFVSSEASTKKDETGTFGFANKRAEAWWNCREMLDPSSGSTVCLPPNDELVGELTAPSYRERGGAKLLVESKEDIKKRLGRSTDHADAVVMALNTRPVVFEKPKSAGKRRSPARKSVFRKRR